MRKIDQRGQILVIILLVLVVSLAIVLSLVSRSVTDVRTSVTTEQSNRAYFAAEAGVEEALKQLKGDPYYTSSDTSFDLPNQSKVTTVVTQLGGTTPFAFPNPVGADNPAQVNFLKDYKCLSQVPVLTSCRNGGSYRADAQYIDIYWGDPSYSGFTALEATFIYENGGTYSLAKKAYDPDSSRSSLNNFENTEDAVPGNTTCSTAITTQLGSKTYKNCKRIDLAGLGIPGNSALYIGRLRLMYNAQAEPVAVVPVSASLPAQGSEIVSTGKVEGGATRKLKVFRSFPSLPGIFDYVLFNGSTQALSK